MEEITLSKRIDSKVEHSRKQEAEVAKVNVLFWHTAQLPPFSFGPSSHRPDQIQEEGGIDSTS